MRAHADRATAREPGGDGVWGRSPHRKAAELPGTKRVAIVGAALSDCGRVDTKTPFELHQQASARALADAGLTKDDVDGVASCGMGLLAPRPLRPPAPSRIS